ncbi:NPCBM/NEW2 domain-containing protein [Nonomuraea africana]|uniref:NPCBM/NEW2 domain-containing protein n=1 Tax=Nonomuraea africana TaxID=46171 RepID=UPI0033D2D8D6
MAVVVLAIVTPSVPAVADVPPLTGVTLVAGDAELPLDGATSLTVEGRRADGAPADLSGAEITVTSADRGMAVPSMAGHTGTLRAGTKGAGQVTLTAAVTLDGTTLHDDLTVTVLPKPARPYVHDYSKTLTMKMFMADNKGKVSLTFEQGLEVIRKVDSLTRGIPKIFYLVGWQYDGHDTGYPAFDVVNPKLKRAQDATAADSLRWLVAEARKHHTTVSFHINLLDASASSPLWQEYLDKDLIARNADGSLRTYVWGYPISYTREWTAGLTTRRIDRLFDLVDLAAIGTVHVDAFHQYIPGYGNDLISPYHGVGTDQEIETQKKIIRYFRDKGVDVTSEFTFNYRKDPLLGLQPMAWHLRNVDPMKIPASLHVGGAGGDARFGTSMQGESRIKADPATLKGFLDDFATTTLTWQYLNRLDRLSDTGGVVTFSGGVTSRNVEGGVRVEQGEVVLRDRNDLFVPALWQQHKEIVAYSRDGYATRTWKLPADWTRVPLVDIYRVGPDGLTQVAGNRLVAGGRLTLSLPPGTAYSIVPHGTGVGPADTARPMMFDALLPRPGATEPSKEAVAFAWLPSRNADSYHLTVATDAAFTTVVAERTTKGVAAMVRGLAQGTRHYWKVEARNEAGAFTISGAPLTFTTAVTEPPAAPSATSAYRLSADSVLVSWPAAQGAETYTVRRGSESIAEGLTGTGFVDDQAGGGPYDYQVVAVNALGAGPAGPVTRERALGQETHLSDRSWVSATSGWGSVAKDRAVGGGALRLNGASYAKGLGTHAVSEIVYDLEPGDALFRAVVGIDDAKKVSAASVAFRVVADGELLYDSGAMTSQPYTAPREVVVDVAGRSRLLLQVLDAGDGNNSDHADWANARLATIAE